MNNNTNRPRPKHRTRRGPRPLNFEPTLQTVLSVVLTLGGEILLHAAGLT